MAINANSGQVLLKLPVRLATLGGPLAILLAGVLLFTWGGGSDDASGQAIVDTITISPNWATAPRPLVRQAINRFSAWKFAASEELLERAQLISSPTTL